MIRFRILKKNQVLMFVIALVLVTTGYLSYNPEATKDVVSTTLDNSTLANIGDATLVSSSAIVDKIQTNNENTTETGATNQITNNINQNEITNNSIETSVTTSGKDDYFTNSKIERDKMYSQMLESYQKMVTNTNISEEQKSIATNEINKINTTKNAIMIAENLIKTKGLEDVVIFVNIDSVSVIIKAEELTQEQIAQIQNIVTRELNTDISNIHISNK